MPGKSWITRLCCACVIGAILAPAILSCSSTLGKSLGSVPSNPFTYSYDLDEATLKALLEPDSADVLMAASPFYVSEQPAGAQKIDAYNQVRAKKIAEIYKEALNLGKSAVALKAKLGEARNAYLNYVDAIVAAEPKVKAFTGATVDQLGQIYFQEILVEAEYNSVQSESDDDILAKSTLDYLKVIKALELGRLYIEDIDNLNYYGALMMAYLERSNDVAVKKANDTFNQAMKVTDDLAKGVEEVYTSLKKVDYGLKQLDTASYYFTMAAYDFISTSTADLEKKLGTLVPGDKLSREDIQMFQIYLGLYEKWQEQLKKEAQSIPTNRLLDVTVWKPNAGVAYAADTTPMVNYPKAVAAMDEGLKANDATAKRARDFVVWTTAKAILRDRIEKLNLELDPRIGVGMAIDTAKYFENRILNEIGEQTGLLDAREVNEEDWKNWQAISQNAKAGISGAQILKDSAKVMQESEERAAKWVSEKAVSAAELAESLYTTGHLPSDTSQPSKGAKAIGIAAGEMSKLATGKFSLFAQGMYQALDPTSSALDVSKGMVKIAISIGGPAEGPIRGAEAKAGALLRGSASGMMERNLPKIESSIDAFLTKLVKLHIADPSILSPENIGKIIKLESALKRYATLSKAELERLGNIWASESGKTIGKSARDINTRLLGSRDMVKRLLGDGGWEFLEKLGAMHMEDIGMKAFGIAQSPVALKAQPAPPAAAKPSPPESAATAPKPPASSQPTAAPPPAKPATEYRVYKLILDFDVTETFKSDNGFLRYAADEKTTFHAESEDFRLAVSYTAGDKTKVRVFGKNFTFSGVVQASKSSYSTTPPSWVPDPTQSGQASTSGNFDPKWWLTLGANFTYGEQGGISFDPSSTGTFGIYGWGVSPQKYGLAGPSELANYAFYDVFGTQALGTASGFTPAVTIKNKLFDKAGSSIKFAGKGVDTVYGNAGVHNFSYSGTVTLKYLRSE